MEREFVAAARAELVKTFVLASRGIDVQMFASGIDEVWHEMLLDEDAYVEFSLSACGHIVPHSEDSDHGPVAFVEAYEREYGKLPEIWFCNEDGKVDMARYEAYLVTGEVFASWKCSATHNCLDILTPMIREGVPGPGERPKPRPPNGSETKL